MTLMKVCLCVRVFHEECVHAPRCLCVDVRGCCSATMCLICVCTCVHGFMYAFMDAWVHKLVGANFRCCSPRMIILFYGAGSFTEKQGSPVQLDFLLSRDPPVSASQKQV